MTSLPRIFVQIASYRDPECQWTVRDLFEKAEHPQRVSVGICWQWVPEEDAHCFEIETRPEQVRIHKVHALESKGVCWARSQTQQLWGGEEYTLSLDSHMRFTPGWDTLLIDELARCDSAKPVLSCDPPGYTPPHNLVANPRNAVKMAGKFQPNGAIRFVGVPLAILPEVPLKGAFIAAGFMFSDARVIEEVPYDPYLYFDQEEASLSARLYTHGWDVFCPGRIITYHYYNDHGKSGRPLHWGDHKGWGKLQDFAQKRYNHLMGQSPSDEAQVIAGLDSYGMGTARPLGEYFTYCGINFATREVSEKGRTGGFMGDLSRYQRPAKKDQTAG